MQVGFSGHGGSWAVTRKVPDLPYITIHQEGPTPEVLDYSHFIGPVIRSLLIEFLDFHFIFQTQILSY